MQGTNSKSAPTLPTFFLPFVAFFGLILIGIFLLLLASGQFFIMALFGGFVLLCIIIFLLFSVIAFKGAQKAQAREQKEIQNLFTRGFAQDNTQSQNLLEELQEISLLQTGRNHIIEYTLKGNFRGRDWIIFPISYRLAPASGRWRHLVFFTKIDNQSVFKESLTKIPNKISGTPFKVEIKGNIFIAHAPKAAAFFFDMVKILEQITEIVENIEKM